LDEEEKGWKISGKVSLADSDVTLSELQYAVVLLSEGRPGEKITFADTNNE
jgi:hypothetical protein